MPKRVVNVEKSQKVKPKKQTKLPKQNTKKDTKPIRVSKVRPSQNKKLLTTPPVGNARAIGRKLCIKKWGRSQWSALNELLQRESGWQIGRVNESSYACGIGQSLPCSKMYGYMPNTHWVNGKLFIKNPKPRREITWTLAYIGGRYQTPANALSFHDRNNWY